MTVASTLLHMPLPLLLAKIMSVYFDQSQMRLHLYHCLEASEMKPFNHKMSTLVVGIASRISSIVS